MAGIFIFAFLLILLLVWYLPRFIRRPKTPAAIKPWGARFPEGFLWGSGEDAYQHEGGNIHSDWYEWEKSEPRPFKDGSVSGDCSDFYRRYEFDFGLAQKDGHNSHRIGIEWGRVEPEEGQYDEEVFNHYLKMLSSLKEKGFTVFLNLWHFTLPAWAAAKGGWLNRDVFLRWESYVRECAKRFCGFTDYWSTMIDAQIYVLRGWFLGDIPPLKKDKKEGIKVLERLLDAHALAYRIIKDLDPSSRVGMIYFFALYESAGNLLDNFVCGQLDRLFNWTIPDALISGVLDVRIAGEPRLKTVNDKWNNTLDWLGVNYYYRQIVYFSPGTVGFVKMVHGPGRLKSDMGWELYPEGLYKLCKNLSRRYPGLPLLVTESGMADASDKIRPVMILSHLAWLARLISEGFPVYGYAYWSLTDNLEWTEGFEPKFGLYRIDRNSQDRIETDSARLFSFIAKNNRLPFKEEFMSITQRDPQALLLSE